MIAGTVRWAGRDFSREIRGATLWAGVLATIAAAALGFAVVKVERAYHLWERAVALEAQPLCQPDWPPGATPGAQCRPTGGATVAGTRLSGRRRGRRLVDLLLDGGRRVTVTVADHDGLYDLLAYSDRVTTVLDGDGVSEVRTLDASGTPAGRILTRESPHNAVTNEASVALLGVLVGGISGLGAFDQAARRRALQRAAERPAQSVAGELSVPFVARATWGGTLICAFFAALGLGAALALGHRPLSDPTNTGLVGPAVIGVLVAAAVAARDGSRRVEITHEGLAVSSFLGTTRVPYRDVTEMTSPVTRYGRPLRIYVRDRKQPHELPIGSFSRRDRARIVHEVMTRQPGIAVDRGVLELWDGTAAV